ncbi:MAG: 30S ribosomal protein S4e [Candidatus Bathyarchaeota archaeon]|nr:30S ribosomal protein S4e [Candidatus Bathyarchaeota archaeon]MCX8176899.1 30S ribosomal protein S4e [Candidatus Bathyarchaeota archaeon]MDW8193415.1 30S ribosomal protein S4e [Nitrososphaerota archaeon]
MGKKGTTTTLKRKPAPRIWPIHRKEYVWVVRPSSGPHSMRNSIPLVIILRDMLGYAETRKEAKAVVSQGKVKVDGKIRRDDSFPVGAMDVLSIQEINKNFRVLPHPKGLIIHPISEEEAKFKLCRIENKTTVKNGNIMLSLHDGSTLLVKVADPKNPQEDVYSTLDTVKISLPERQILQHIKMEKNVVALVIGGKNIGRYGKVVDIEETAGKKRQEAIVTIQDASGNRFQTTMDYVFVIGEESPLISLPEASISVV